MEPPTVEKLVNEVGISLDLLDQMCSDEHLKSISLFLDWRRAAPHLGLSERDIEAIEFESITEFERRLKMLLKWKQECGSMATFGNLVRVLLVIVGNADDAERVCRLLQTPAGKHSASTASATTPTTPGDHQQSSPVTATEASLCSTVVETSKVSIQLSESDTEREIRELVRLLSNIPLPSATPPAPLPLPTPLKGNELESNAFDMIAALMSAGVPLVVEQILQSLDVISLLMSEQVSSIWRDVIEDLRMWKHMIKCNIDSNPLWRGLFKRRGWHKNLGMPAEQIPRQFYRQLHHSACRDIHSLKANWRKGYYTKVTRVKTDSRIWCLQFDDDKIVTGHEDSTIKIWDRSTLQLLRVLRGHENAVCCLQYNEEVVISGAWDCTVKVWDFRTGQVINDLHHHTAAVRSLKFTTDTLVTGSDDHTVAVWNIKSPTDITLRKSLQGHTHVLAVDFSKTSIISGSEDNTIKVWDNLTGKLVQTLKGHSDSVYCLQLQGNHIISGSRDKTIRITNMYTGEHRVLCGHNNNVTCVAVDNKRIVSGSFDRTVKVWDLAAALDASPIPRQVLNPRSTARQRRRGLGTRRLDAGSSSDTCCVTTLEGHTHYVWALQFDDFQVVSGSGDGTLLLHNFLDRKSPIKTN